MNHDKKEENIDKRIDFIARHYKDNYLDGESAWKQFVATKKIRQIHPIRRYWSVAAAAVLVLIGISLFFINKQISPEWIIVETGPRQIKDIYLPDSTYISLAENSFLKYDSKKYNNERREIEMDGRLYVEVKPDASRPFSVYSHLAQITVLGTSFQVTEKDLKVEVEVFTGKVNFSASTDKKSVILNAGMSATYDDETSMLNIKEEQNINTLSWKTGELKFNETPIHQVLQILNEHYHVSVISFNPINENTKLTATFNDLPLEEVLFVINQTLDINLVLDNSR